MTSQIFQRILFRWRERGGIAELECKSIEQAKKYQKSFKRGRIAIERVERTPYKPNTPSCE